MYTEEEKLLDLIKQSSEKNISIVCDDNDARCRIIDIAYFSGINIPEPITIGDMMNSMKKRSAEVIVIDVDSVLNTMMREICGCTVNTAVTISREH